MFAKLKDLDQFTVSRLQKSFFKTWDDNQKKYLTSPSYVQGYSKVYLLDIENPGANDNQLEVSRDQMKQMLEGVLGGYGVADIRGKKFSVKTNGQTGKEIRYFINPVYSKGNLTHPLPPKTPITQYNASSEASVQAQSPKNEPLTEDEISQIPF